MPAYQSCLKVRYVESPGAGIHWEAQSAEDQESQDYDFSYLDEGLLNSAPYRLSVTVMSPPEVLIPYAFHYQSVDNLLVPPPPRAG